MKKDEIVVGRYYAAKVNGKMTAVRVDAIRERDSTRYGKTCTSKTTVTIYDVVNIATGRMTTFRSAAKFRFGVDEANGKLGKPVDASKEGKKPNPRSGKKLGRDEDDHPESVQRDIEDGYRCRHGVCIPEPCSQCRNGRATQLEGDNRPDPTTKKDGSLATGSTKTTAASTTEVEQRPDPTTTKGKSGAPGAKNRPTAATAKKPSLATTSEDNDDPFVPSAVVPGPAPSAAPKMGNPATTLASRLLEVQARSVASRNSAPNVEVQALAGTGKTTTMIEGIKEIRGVKSNLTPSDQQAEVWRMMALGRNESMRISSFSTKITDELKSRITESGLSGTGVEAKGIHALGFGSVVKRFGRVSPERSSFVVKDITARSLGYETSRLLKGKDADIAYAVDSLVSLCKQTLTDPTEEGLDDLSGHYDVELGGIKSTVYNLVPQVLDKCLEPQDGKWITFDDMIWLPIKHGLPIYKVDHQLVDEAQDLNRMQQELMYRAGHRITFVGDEHQAIYGFAGADAESMKRMRQHLASETFPLTVTRRCGKAIVREAQRYVPGYQAHESNPVGMVGHLRMEDGQDNYRSKTGPGDFVLCRYNAPLVRQCFRFIKAGIKAGIMGKKIGEGLISLIDKSKAESTPNLIAWLGDWLAKETANEQAKRYPSESRIEGLQDRQDCLLAFCEGTTNASEVRVKVLLVFTDNKDDKGVTLSSIHKSKGLEARRVFILQPKGVGRPVDKMQPWEVTQERNLRYVAITRAIEELYYVTER